MTRRRRCDLALFWLAAVVPARLLRLGRGG
jgi:hypothetical protein